jgi:hypothetical protein
MEYTIVDAPTTNELIEQVESMIDAGFEPIGGVSVSHVGVTDDRGYTTDVDVFYQAMIKY